MIYHWVLKYWVQRFHSTFDSFNILTYNLFTYNNTTSFKSKNRNEKITMNQSVCEQSKSTTQCHISITLKYSIECKIPVQSQSTRVKKRACAKLENSCAGNRKYKKEKQ